MQRCLLQSNGVIEDWELFADPQEIERRKAERKRQALPLYERQQNLASEWVDARARAARAKSANDKSQQKAMGQVIRTLKLEMARLGQPASPLNVVIMTLPAEKSSSAGHAVCVFGTDLVCTMIWSNFLDASQSMLGHSC